MNRIGIFTASRFRNAEIERMMTISGCFVHLARHEIKAGDTIYTFHCADNMEDIYRVSGLTFDSVQLHWSVNPDTMPYILARCRNTNK
jgi:hypothetical protein